jgi:hypothetical protein
MCDACRSLWCKKNTYVKNEGYNFNAMTKALKLVVNCDALSLEESFQGTCFGHVSPKFFNHAPTNEKV